MKALPLNAVSSNIINRLTCALLVPLLHRVIARGASWFENAHDGQPSPASPVQRSEEHTSELQSLMRISYAVFCLKKKNKRTNKTTNAIKYFDIQPPVPQLQSTKIRY